MTGPRWQLDRPVDLAEKLETADWSYSLINGVRLCELCPMCAAMVPTRTGPADGPTPRQAHVQWHVVMAKLLYDLERPPSSFRPDPPD